MRGGGPTCAGRRIVPAFAAAAPPTRPALNCVALALVWQDIRACPRRSTASAIAHDAASLLLAIQPYSSGVDGARMTMGGLVRSTAPEETKSEMNWNLNGRSADVEQALAGGAQQRAGWFRFYFADQRWEW